MECSDALVWYGGLFELTALLLTTELSSSSCSSSSTENDCPLELLQSVVELAPTEQEDDPCEVAAARLEESILLRELDRKNSEEEEEEAVDSEDEWM